MRLFDDDADYAPFVRVIDETLAVQPMRICAACVMPNHWHLVLWPRGDDDLPAFMQRLTITHVRRWLEYRHCVGMGHVNQGRYKSFPVQNDLHYLTVCRYVERNALRARLVRRAEAWRWGSLWRRQQADETRQAWPHEGPVALPRDWVSRVNGAEPAETLGTLRTCLLRGRPYGQQHWVKRMTSRLGLESSMRPVGRPTKRANSRIKA